MACTSATDDDLACAPVAAPCVPLHGGAGTSGGLTLGLPEPWLGQIKAELTDVGCPPATGFQILTMGQTETQSEGGYWNIDANPPTGLPNDMELCLHYQQPPIDPSDPATFEGGIIEQNLRIVHGDTDTATSDPDVCNSATWTSLELSRRDMVNNIICGYTDTLSPFAVVMPLPGLTFAAVPGPIVAYATSTRGARVSYTPPTAADAAGNARPVTCTPPSGSWFAPGKTTVTCSATDAVGPRPHHHVHRLGQIPGARGRNFLPAPHPRGRQLDLPHWPSGTVQFKLTGASAGITNLCAKLVVTKDLERDSGHHRRRQRRGRRRDGHDFKYRNGKKLYAYRWKTRGETEGTYRLRADLGDDVCTRGERLAQEGEVTRCFRITIHRSLPCCCSARHHSSWRPAGVPRTTGSSRSQRRLQPPV